MSQTIEPAPALIRLMVEAKRKLTAAQERQEKARQGLVQVSVDTIDASDAQSSATCAEYVKARAEHDSAKEAAEQLQRDFNDTAENAIAELRKRTSSAHRAD
jgi:hypothetical protein